METKEPASGLWTPEEGQISPRSSVAEIVNAYSLFLEVCHPDHHKQFEARLQRNPDAARSEAVVFSWLRAQGYWPQVAESLGKGGMDFLCLPKSDDPFLIEVTSLNKEAVERRSGLPDELDEVARSFSMITPNLWSKSLHKAPQLSGYDFPRVLAICLTHVGASVLLGTLAAEWLMTSEPRIALPIAKEEPSSTRNETDLKTAAFFEIHDGAIVPLRQSISAILLISIWDNQLDIIGMIHPAAAVPLDYRIFREVPFLKVKWPIIDYTITTEWVIGRPNPCHFHHHKVKMIETELRGETNQ
jgi:hypothetical protein